MSVRTELWLARCCGVILLGTGLAKVLSGFGHSAILWTIDPVFGIRFKHLFWLVGGLEVLAVTGCIVIKSPLRMLQTSSVLGAGFLAYRLLLAAAQTGEPCRCLGVLTDQLHISPHLADGVMCLLSICLFASGSAAIMLNRRDIDIPELAATTES